MPAETNSVNAPQPGVEAEVSRIRGLLQKSQFAAALAASQMLLRRVPDNRDVLYLIAVSQRYLNQIPGALATLAQCETLHPGYSRLYQERGHCHIAARNPVAALEAYLAAVAINVALPASWKALEVLFRSAGRIDDAKAAADHVSKLNNLPPPVVSATGLFADGEIHAAEALIRGYLQANPENVEAMRLLGRIGLKLDVLDDAEFLLESVLVFAPDYGQARYDYVQVLLKRHKNARALEEAEKLLKAEPSNRDYRAVYGTVCVALGRFDQALKTYRDLVTDSPRAASVHLSIAHVLKTLGKQQEAIESYRTAAAAAPGFGDAYWSLANLKTYRFMPEEIATMRRYEDLPTTPLIDRFHLCFALGKAFEDGADYAQSFGYYERGNALKSSEIRFSLGPVERSALLQRAVCTESFMTVRRGYGCPRPDPIFIVGLPRSGSTLIEQILASHSQVEGTMELADIPRTVHALQGRQYDESNPPYPGLLADLDAERCLKLGEKYLADTQIYRSSKPYFIDKMPNNFRHIGLIHLILPNAKIIDARREAMACCFSNFKQLFASGQEFTYRIDDIARYYRMYVELMAHWDSVLPGKVLRVHHEEVVDGLETQVRRILQFCNLPFEPACLEFHQTTRSVRTASSEQVRQPIFREGLEQWRHFEPWLEPLRIALELNATPNRCSGTTLNSQTT